MRASVRSFRPTGRRWNGRAPAGLTALLAAIVLVPFVPATAAGAAPDRRPTVVTLVDPPTQPT